MAVHPFVGPIGLPSFDTFWTEGATDGFGRNYWRHCFSDWIGQPARQSSRFPKIREFFTLDGVPPGVFDYQVNNQDPAVNIDLHYSLAWIDLGPKIPIHLSIGTVFQRSNGTVQVAILCTEPPSLMASVSSIVQPTFFRWRGSTSPDLPSAHAVIWMSRGARPTIQIAADTPSFDATGSGDAYLIASGKPAASGSLTNTAMCTGSFEVGTRPMNLWSSCLNPSPRCDGPPPTRRPSGTMIQISLGLAIPRIPPVLLCPPLRLNPLGH